MTKPNEPFFKPEDFDHRGLVESDSDQALINAIDLNIREAAAIANRLVEPLLEEMKVLQSSRSRLQEGCTELEKENERLRAENEHLRIKDMRHDHELCSEIIAEHKAELTSLKAEIEQAPVVVIDRRIQGSPLWAEREPNAYHTHTARLVRIEEIKK